jgi:hypothetical protein
MTEAPDSPPPGSRRNAERRQLDDAALPWRLEVVARFTSAVTPDERAAILMELDLPHTLDEDAALALYGAQPQQSSAFIQRHLPRGRRADDPVSPWHRLMQEAQARQDDALRFALYRAQTTPEQWARDTTELVASVSQTLSQDLDRRHPNRWRPDIGPHLAQLALQRGKELVPYLVRRAQDVWSTRRREGYQVLLELSQRERWPDLSAALLRCCASAAEYDRAVAALLTDRETDEAQLRQRLLFLSGAGPEAAAPSRHIALRDTTLVALYERFPHLARGPFRRQLEPSPSRPLSGLFEAALAHRDDELIDHLCARLAVRAERSGAERLLQMAALAATYLEKACPDAALLDRRACAILVRVPARAIRNQRDLMRRNPLARMLFAHAGEACLAVPGTAADLLEADEIHVRAIAVRAITSDDPRALPLARQNRDRLLAALDGRLPRVVARQALRMLERLADEPDAVQRILIWTRAALAEPKPSYPTGELTALLARQLKLHPTLREPREIPIVYRRPVA